MSELETERCGSCGKPENEHPVEFPDGSTCEGEEPPTGPVQVDREWLGGGGWPREITFQLPDGETETYRRD